MATANGDPAPELDIQKLHALSSEQQDLYLLTFTADLAKFVKELDADGASAHQIYVKKELFKIINLPSPAPTRVIRNNLARCFAGIFAKGDRKLLFESINELVAILNGGSKADKESRAKHAAAHCLGVVYEAAGDSAIHQSTLAVSSLLRVLKGATHAGLRASIYGALGRVYVSIGASGDEAIVRDVWKQARSAVGDKSLLVQSKACYCLEQLAAHTPFFDNSNDFDKLQYAAWRALESPSHLVREAAASCFGRVLVKHYSETAATVALPKPKTKKAKRQSRIDGDDEDERPGSPAPTKPVTTLAFTLADMLRQLSDHYCRPHTSNRARAGVALCYINVLRHLGEAVVESNYSSIAKHLFTYLLGYPSITHSRYRLLMARKFVRVILEDVVGREILGESAQLSAARFLINDILKDYPQALKERPEPSKHSLTGALSALASLISSLGSAVSVIADTCRDALLQVLMHPSYTVQVHVSHCLRAFVVACPQQLLTSVTICINSVNRELNLLGGPRQSPRRCVGYANGLAAVLSTSSSQPLYGSVDVYSRVLSQATTLLKSSSSSDLRISSTQIQVAWILLGGLMSLGPNFIKIHLSQLLLLWKNALPKPLNKDNMTNRNLLELSFLAHVRECALGSILTFLEYNSRLLTIDVTKRLAAMLQNTSAFLHSLPSKKATDDIAQRLSPALQLQDFDIMVRRRVLQCYTRLVEDGPGGEALFQSNLLPLAISCFADPENYANSLSASIASSAGNFESIWDVGDNYSFGVTGLVNGFDLKPLAGESERSDRAHWITRRGLEAQIDRLLVTPAFGAREHDSIMLYSGNTELSDPPATQVVNAAIYLFATALPVQAPKVQESILEQLTSFLSDSNLQRDPARKAAMSVNIATALFMALKVATRETSLPPGDIRSEPVQKAMRELLRVFLLSSDQFVRSIAAQALGRLCKSAGNAFTVREVDDLIDQIIANRDPVARSGFATALGHIYAQLGGMAGGFHLKKILGVLNSLSSDPHPVVHFWALESICRVANSADLNFAPFVTSTLGMLAQLLIADTHNEEVGSAIYSNLEVELPTPAVIARCVDSIINVLGPDLQDAAKTRDLIMVLLEEFSGDVEELELIETLKCQEHLSLYAPGHMNFKEYVCRLQANLDSSFPTLRAMAVDGLHNLMRRNADEVIRTAQPGLEEKLWLLLDSTPDDDAVKNIMRNWLHQTALTDTAPWVQRCNTILTKVMVKSRAEAEAPKKAALDLQDEEIAGFATAAGTVEDEKPAGSSSQELLRWQTRTFAMDLLSELVVMVARDASASDESAACLALQGKVADVVRIAFSASTAGVIALRLRGMKIIDQILKLFGKTPDPDFPEASLLEQYQAQIGSALTPAFAADSSPELAAAAINVCASFIATGIVTDVDRMGRILKLLVSALENFSADTENASIGDLKGLSSNALVMVKMAVFSAWAELQIASAEQNYLVEVVKPHIAKLTPLWLASLREYARLRFEPDISTTGSAAMSGNLDSIYAALNRETLLHFYQSSWLNLVDAIASLIDEDSEFVFDALDGRIDESPNGEPKPTDINYRDEPVAFFFVLFGLAFEALAGRSDSQTSKEQMLEILHAVKKILRPSVAGLAIYQEVVFSEAMDMFDRLVLTEALNVQAVVVEIAKNLCLAHPSARIGHAPEEEKLSEDIDQLFELTRIIVLVIGGLVPNLAEDKSRVRHELNDEAVGLLTLSLSALVDASAVFPSVIKTDLYACIIHIFATILATPSCQTTVVPQALPILRRFLSSLVQTPQSETPAQLRSALARFLAILSVAQRREFDDALACEKNTLLACTVLLSTAGSLFEPADPVLARTVSAITDCLASRLPSKVAASCVRSLLLLPRRDQVADALATRLLPQLLTFSTQPTDIEGLAESREIVVAALTTWAVTINPSKRPTAVALVVPALVGRAACDGRETYRETAGRLLELAAADAAAFKAVVTGLIPGVKSLLEEVIREGNVKKSAGLEEGNGEPTIALKMNF
ncbi:ARM repeat-containing protein [Trichodelitschia bisporula]|uniref:ARM repeat-containing protein n=1 Tax=Trichodelitschia bisporula TaxID=703511 RepID=A0A6G1HQB5_9PEZI|nr:ARM repeat-containing protein [Trichodelitschia bisporula]